MPLIELKNICKNYGKNENEVRALSDVSLDVERGELISIIGKSGCGKSTPTIKYGDGAWQPAMPFANSKPKL